MRVVWSADAQRDLARVHDFLVLQNRSAADRSVLVLTQAPARLVDMPRMGARVETLIDNEIRRLVVAGRYEVRYEIAGSDIVILRIFHTREDR